MEALFKIQADELDEKLIFQIKKIFEGKSVTIIISTELDESDYLKANPANKKHILESIVSEPAITFTPDEFEKHAKNLLKQKNSKGG